jgi:hypothetical protein
MSDKGRNAAPRRAPWIAWLAIAWMGSAALALPAWAEGDAFAGLVPGDALSEAELSTYFGGAVLNFTVNGGELNSNTGAIDVSQLNTIGSGAFGNASGIVAVTQFQGDNNNVSVNINLEVNINTVTISGATGSTISVSNDLNLGGGVIGAFIP